MQSIRVEEGKTVAVLKGHRDVVSTLLLAADERSCLSGGWDKIVVDWDLESGLKRRTMLVGHDVTGQVSALANRPTSAATVDWSSLQQRAPSTGAIDPGTGHRKSVAAGATPDSANSFDPLFDEEEEHDITMPDAVGESEAATPEANIVIGEGRTDPVDDTSPDILLCSCIDGAISIWDRRQARQCSRIPLTKGTPPWCMSACWSADGMSVYAGRRNGAVEAYDLRSSLDKPQKTFKMPHNSGPVSLVQAMPNGRSLIW